MQITKACGVHGACRAAAAAACLPIIPTYIHTRITLFGILLTAKYNIRITLNPCIKLMRTEWTMALRRLVELFFCVYETMCVCVLAQQKFVKLYAFTYKYIHTLCLIEGSFLLCYNFLRCLCACLLVPMYNVSLWIFTINENCKLNYILLCQHTHTCKYSYKHTYMYWAGTK